MKPKAPKRPIKPIEPLKILMVEHSDYLKVGSSRLSDILAKLPKEVKPEQASISIEEEYDYCGCDKYVNVRLVWETSKPNPNYDKEMDRYNRKLRNYEKKLAEYEVKQKAYLEWQKVYLEKQAILAKKKAEQDKMTEIARLEKRLAKLKKNR